MRGSVSTQGVKPQGRFRWTKMDTPASNSTLSAKAEKTTAPPLASPFPDLKAQSSLSSLKTRGPSYRLHYDESFHGQLRGTHHSLKYPRERTRDLLKKIGDIKRTFHVKMGTIKDRNSKDLTEAEDIKKRWQDTQKNYTKVLMTQVTTMLWSFTQSQTSWSTKLSGPLEALL